MNSNILLIYFDEIRYDLIFGSNRKYLSTPSLDALARDSMVFDRAYCSTPLCVPSRTSMFSAKYASRAPSGLLNNIELTNDDPGLARLLRKSGYELSLFGKNHVFTEESIAQWDRVESYDLWGKEDRPYNSPPTEAEAMVRRWRTNREIVPPDSSVVWQAQPGGEEADPACCQTAYAIDYLRKRDSGRPFMMYYSFESPHFPFVAPEPYHSMFDLADMPGRISGDKIFEGRSQRLWLQFYGQKLHKMGSDADYRRVQATYLGQIALLDKQIGRMIRALKELGLYDDTVIVFQGDHGDFWGYKGLVGKTNSLYEDMCHIPLSVKIPGYGTGRSNALVSNIDIAPTLLEALGLGAIENADGLSFASLMRGERERHRDVLLGEARLFPVRAQTPEQVFEMIAELNSEEDRPHGWHGQYISGWTHCLIDEDNFKIITNENDICELFNLNADPHENENLAMRLDGHKKLAEMLGKLKQSELYRQNLGEQSLAPNTLRKEKIDG